MSLVNPYVTFLFQQTATDGEQIHDWRSSRQISVNFIGGSPLNRLSWLRSSQVFVDAILRSPSTRWILFNSRNPLVFSRKDRPKLLSLARLTTADVKSLLGPEPYLGLGENDGDVAPRAEPALEVTRLRGPKIVFLGLEELHGTTALFPSSDFGSKKEAPEAVAERITGTPYFSLDVSEVETSTLDIALQSNQLVKDGGQVRFMEARAAMNSMNWFDAAVFAEARSMVDWNSRNKVRTRFIPRSTVC